MASGIISLNDQNLQDYILRSAKDNLILVDFWAEWCNPCKVFSSILEEIINEYSNNKLVVVKIDVDNSPSSTQKYGIRSVPTLLLFKNAELLATKVGVLSKNQLEDFIKIYL